MARAAKKTALFDFVLTTAIRIREPDGEMIVKGPLQRGDPLETIKLSRLEGQRCMYANQGYWADGAEPERIEAAVADPGETATKGPSSGSRKK